MGAVCDGTSQGRRRREEKDGARAFAGFGPLCSGRTTAPRAAGKAKPKEARARPGSGGRGPGPLGARPEGMRWRCVAKAMAFATDRGTSRTPAGSGTRPGQG
ncbi:hypothetical protein GCM10011341_10780 [Frigidibacter albus]|nr:hypothetical protein GCM10011341_10780 [Frigidibacter albus]